ncbi:MAG: TrkH family potassium uptake protein [Bacteriovoracaceae bacterium]|nr:TrkH family potassium uptake protein [Bacteriovoracaceae bacterium]
MIWSRIPYFLELIVNGAFVALFTLSKAKKIPPFLQQLPPELLSRWLVWLAPVLVFISLLNHFKRSNGVEDFFRKYIFSFIIFVPMLLTFGDPEFIYWLTVVHLFSTLISLNEKMTEEVTSHRFSPNTSLDWVQSSKLTPAQLVILSFALIILIGALLLVLPISSQAGKTISFIDALFMSTSATCVTGLAPVSLADDFSLFGQLVILTLIQVGGLGIMTLSSCIALFMGRNLGVREQVLMQDVLDSSSSEELLSLIVDIVKFTLLIEFIGAICLTFGFYLEDYEIGQSLYFGFYHSISAFCNAGLALFNNSLEDFKFSPFIHGTVAALIILGGLGFSVIQEIRNAIITKKKFINFSLHSKIVIVTNALLIAFGTTYLFFGEFLHGFAEYGLWGKMQVAFFQSVTTRTAGFNSVPLTDLHPHSIYMMVLLMFVGASPGSTGGGIKTTTFALLVQSVKSTLSNHNRVEMFERTIPNVIVVRAIAIFIISLITVSTVLLVLMRLEPNKDFLALLFETVSAFGTVGLSLNLTATLSSMGKLVISAVMFIGRVGPLTLVLAVGQNVSATRVRYPESKVLIG